MRDDLSYDAWKKELDIWSDFTDLDANRKGGALFLTLKGKAREAVLSGVDRAKIKSDKGVEEITKCLDELFEKDKSQSAFAAYDAFTSYRRSRDTSIQDYIVEFNLKYNKIKTHHMELPDAVLAYYLLKCANLSEEHCNICKATCSDLTYKNMRSQIEKVTADLSSTTGCQSDYHGQPQYCIFEGNEGLQDYEYEEYYEPYPVQSAADSGHQLRPETSSHPEGAHAVLYQQQWQGQSHDTYGANRNPRTSHRTLGLSAGLRQNPPDEFGAPSRCSFCRSIYHWIQRCPDAQRSGYTPSRRGSRRPYRGRGSFRGGSGHSSGTPTIWLEEDYDHPEEDIDNVILVTEPGDDHNDILSETIGYAVIDSGCTQTVCGNIWLRTYLDTLSNREHRAVQTEQSRCKFKFGDGPVYLSTTAVILPVTFGSNKVKLRVQVVNCDVPLLISRQSLKGAHCFIDFVGDKVFMFGEEIPVKLSKTGHYCISLLCDDKRETIQNVLFTSPLVSEDGKSNQKKILKLHKQFAHPSSERLKQLIRNSGVCDSGIDKLVDDVSQSCDICKKFRRSPPRPVVSFPLATEFNETVAMDLKFINSRPVLHMIDHATRYSTACLLSNKKPASVIQGVMTHWIQIFGYPTQVLTDNGGEFVNSELIELAEKFNIVLKTTAAESPWSNGMCEKHNGVIGDMVAKIQMDSDCSLELALSWALSAKNSLMNVYGFSPNQLVFGYNVRLPDVHTDKLPAQNRSCSSDLVAKHLLALHKARQAFVAQESCEKLRRALNKQTRTYSNFVYRNGDSVYFKRQGNIEWHGPAKVLGRDGSQYLLKHGGLYVRVHPCKMQLVDHLAQVESPVRSTDCVGSEVESNDTKIDRGSQDCQSDDSESEHDDSHMRMPRGVPPSPPATPVQVHQHQPDNIVPVMDHMDAVHEDVNEDSQDEDISDGSQYTDELPLQPQTDIPVPRALSRLADYNKPPLQKSAQVEDAQIHLNQPSGVSEVQEDDYQDQDLNPKTTIVNTPRDLPTPSTQIKFRASGSEEWCQCEVISKAGKTTTGNWHYMNIKPYNAESAHCVSFKEAEWKEVIPEEPDVEEVYFGTSANSRRFDEAKAQEIAKWKEFGTFVEVEDTGQPRISTKWVCTEKLKGGKLVLKARLVARGFEEDKAQLRTDSPTCYKESLRLLLCILASKKWKLQSIDIKSAYLQGNNISRSIFLQPPDCANSKKLWKLVKTPYGLVDAGRQWYIRVVKLFISLGAVQAKCDRAVFIWKDPSDSGPCGVLVSHVDDFLYGGNSFFLNTILPKIRAAFQIGLEESNNMKYLGLDVSQVAQGINLSLDNYASSLTEIDTSGVGVNKKQILTSDQIRQFKQVVGQINWVATQARPDIAFDSCVMSNSASESTVADLHGINKVVRKVRGQPVSLFFSNDFDLNSCQLVCFSDASFANLRDRGSQGGFIMFIVDGQGLYAPVAWQSKRVKRVVNSTLSAECLEAVEAAETCILLRARLEEMLCLSPNSIKISLLTDSKSLLDAVYTSTSVENKRLQIDVNMLREMVETGDIHEFRWIPTEHQLANPLTKKGASPDHLFRILKYSHQLRYQCNTGLFM